MSEQKTLGATLRDAVVELQLAAIAAGVIRPDERIVYLPGSRSHDKAPMVTVHTPRGMAYQFDMVPEFTPLTRGREVAVAMATVAVTLRRLVDAGALPAFIAA